MPHIVLAGGGSAGHVSPMLATAQALTLHSDVTVSCLGTADKLEATLVPEAGLEIDFIPRVPMPRRPGKDLLTLPARLTGAVSGVREILRRRQADAVVGFGGFVCPPAFLAGRLARLPMWLHEQNLVPGMANKLGAALGAKVLAAYPDTGLRDATVVGLPLRAAIANLDRFESRLEARALLGLPGDRPTLLVSGGSLGARSLNEAVVARREQLLADGIDIVHVWGKRNFPDDAAVISHPSGSSYVPLAYLSDMALGYAAADVMLGRAGSNTVFEVATVGLPSVLVPLPHGNGEQARNAQFLLDAGGCRVVPDTEVARALETAVGLLGSPQECELMSDAAQDVVSRYAAHEIAAMILEGVGHGFA